MIGSTTPTRHDREPETDADRAKVIFRAAQHALEAGDAEAAAELIVKWRELSPKPKGGSS